MRVCVSHTASFLPAVFLTATLVHAFVASRIDYCCSLLFGSPMTVTDKLRRVLNAAARVVTNTRKYDSGLHHTMRHDLHWLDMTDRIQFRIAVTVYRCLHGTAPEYLFVPVSTRSSRHCLRSSDSNKLVVPPVKLSTYGRRSFTASGSIVWNSLPEYLRHPTLSVDTFRRYLKTYFLLDINTHTTS